MGSLVVQNWSYNGKYIYLLLQKLQPSWSSTKVESRYLPYSNQVCVIASCNNVANIEPLEVPNKLPIASSSISQHSE